MSSSLHNLVNGCCNGDLEDKVLVLHDIGHVVESIVELSQLLINSPLVPKGLPQAAAYQMPSDAARR